MSELPSCGDDTMTLLEEEESRKISLTTQRQKDFLSVCVCVCVCERARHIKHHHSCNEHSRNTHDKGGKSHAIVKIGFWNLNCPHMYICRVPWPFLQLMRYFNIDLFPYTYITVSGESSIFLACMHG